ncbi:MAG TPA: hypothetical protein VI410_03475, partial [Anaerolineales bacterium]|nr:hypothetical protein [Anaerolineales bacterium]
MSDRPLVYDLTLEELEAWAAALGQPAYRSRQIWEWLYSNLVQTPEQMTNLPAGLRQRLGEAFSFPPSEASAS